MNHALGYIPHQEPWKPWISFIIQQAVALNRMYPPSMLENADTFVPAVCAEVRGSSERNRDFSRKCRSKVAKKTSDHCRSS